MIDLLMNTEQDVVSFLEMLTGGPLDDLDCADDMSANSFFALAGAAQASEMAQFSAR